MNRIRRISPWLSGLTGAFSGTVSAEVLRQFDNGFTGYFAPGLFFGAGMAILLGAELRPLTRRLWVMLAAFICLSATAYRVAVEVAIRFQDWLDTETLLWPGFVAGVVGSVKLTAVLQLTGLGKRGWIQFAVAPLTGGVFGLLLHFWEEPFGLYALYVPWQTALAIALLSFGLPEPKPER